jgi:putative ABC transport system substrate-binding protein
MSLRWAIVLSLVIGSLLTPFASSAQLRGKVPRLGVLEPATPGGGCLTGFQKGLSDLGYVEGKTIAVDYRFADGDPKRMPVLAAELVHAMPDVIWTHSPYGAQTVRQATKTIPIVVGVAGFLVEQKLAASLARPGGNITGFELGDIDAAGKRLELLKEAVPSITRVAVLVDPTMRAYDGVPRSLEPQARSLGLSLQRVEAAVPEAFEAAFVAMMQARAEALFVVDLPVFARNRDRLMALALQHRLPTIAGWRIYAEAGSLIAYGGSVPDLCRRSVSHVDKILKGAKPGELPVELPDKYELFINARTAKVLGLTLPRSILVRADAVIE